MVPLETFWLVESWWNHKATQLDYTLEVVSKFSTGDFCGTTCQDCRVARIFMARKNMIVRILNLEVLLIIVILWSILLLFFAVLVWWKTCCLHSLCQGHVPVVEALLNHKVAAWRTILVCRSSYRLLVNLTKLKFRYTVLHYTVHDFNTESQSCGCRIAPETGLFFWRVLGEVQLQCVLLAFAQPRMWIVWMTLGIARSTRL